MEDVDYSKLSVLDKTNHILEILEFDAKQCKVMSVEELKITAPVVVVKIFEKVVGLHMDEHINEAAFTSNADVVLRTLQNKYGLNDHITPSLLVRGDFGVLEQVMDILYNLVTKNIRVIVSKSTNENNSTNIITREEHHIQKRVFNISSRFNATFTNSINMTGNNSPTQMNSQHFEEWISSRDRAELEKLEQIKAKKQMKAKQQQQQEQAKLQSKRPLSRPKKCQSPRKNHVKKSNSEAHETSSQGSDNSSDWHGWKDNGRRRKSYESEPESFTEVQEPKKEIYCYDTYSGYRVHPRLHALLIKKNNPEMADTAKSTPSMASKIPPLMTEKTSPIRVSKSADVGGKQHLDRTAFTGRAQHLPCYKELEPLDLLLTIEHSFKTKTGKKFSSEKDREVAKNHTTVADHIFKSLVGMTHKFVKPHARMRMMRLNAQINRKRSDIENKEYSKHLEIQIAYKNENGKMFSNLLFSRYKTGQWPSIKVIDKRIRAFYSRINMQLHAVEGDDEGEENVLDPYPAANTTFIGVSKKQLSPEILDVFDARYLFCPDDDDESIEGDIDEL